MGKDDFVGTVVGTSDLKPLPLARALTAELLGTLFLVFFGCGSCTGGFLEADGTKYSPTVVQIALAFGLIVACMVQAICHISGGHLNPAVTVSMIVSGKMSVIKGFLYIVVQCLGSIIGAGLLYAITPDVYRGGLGAATVNIGVDYAQAFGVEFLITFVLIMVVHGVCDDNRDDIKGSAPLAIGLAVSAGHLIGVKYTGAGMNPARALGPPVFLNNAAIWQQQWIYWSGPLLAGLTGGLIYTFLFRSRRAEEASYDF